MLELGKDRHKERETETVKETAGIKKQTKTMGRKGEKENNILCILHFFF